MSYITPLLIEAPAQQYLTRTKHLQSYQLDSQKGCESYVICHHRVRHGKITFALEHLFDLHRSGAQRSRMYSLDEGKTLRYFQHGELLFGVRKTHTMLPGYLTVCYILYIYISYINVVLNVSIYTYIYIYTYTCPMSHDVTEISDF